MQKHKNQRAHPDAPKPIHPDKRTICSRQQFSRDSKHPIFLLRTFAGTGAKKSKRDFPVQTNTPTTRNQ
jgi:hypothetical protein